MKEVLAVHAWPSNAELIRDAARLGYLDGHVLDATYGEGVFWKVWLPQKLTTNDLHKTNPSGHHFDARAFPAEWAQAFDAVVFDPPYKLNGTPATGEQDARYGTAERVNREGRLDLIARGAAGCFEATRRFLLVKVQDQVEGGKMRWQTDIVWDAVRPLGAEKIDRFDMVTKHRPQPQGFHASAPGLKARIFKAEADAWTYVDGREGAKVTERRQRTAVHACASQLLVFRKPARRR